MKLHYTLSENHLITDKEVFTAHPHNVVSYDMKDILYRMQSKGNLVTDVDIQAVLRAFFNEVEEITKEGASVSTELFYSGFSIQGIFQSASDSYDVNRHQLKLNLNATKTLKEVLEDVHLQKVASSDSIPIITEVKDAISESVNTLVSSGGVITLTGSMMKVQGEDESNGVYFIDSSGVRHKVSTLVTNMPSSLVVMVPSLALGEYTVEVVTQFNGGASELNSPRSGHFKNTLSVI